MEECFLLEKIIDLFRIFIETPFSSTHIRSFLLDLLSIQKQDLCLTEFNALSLWKVIEEIEEEKKKFYSVSLDSLTRRAFLGEYKKLSGSLENIGGGILDRIDTALERNIVLKNQILEENIFGLKEKEKKQQKKEKKVYEKLIGFSHKRNTIEEERFRNLFSSIE